MKITKRNKFILIDKYLDGELTQEEAKQIVTRIKEDVEFAKEVEFSKSINKFLSEEIEQIEISEKLEIIYQKNRRNRKSKNTFFHRLIKNIFG
jgi:polyhydroxyalkanoate synthesis regulator phasin